MTQWVKDETEGMLIVQAPAASELQYVLQHLCYYVQYVLQHLCYYVQYVLQHLCYYVQYVIAAFVLFLQESSAFQSREMPLGFMARSGLIDSLMFAEVRFAHSVLGRPSLAASEFSSNEFDFRQLCCKRALSAI